MAEILNNKKKQKIIADYIETNNKSEAARMNNVSEATVRNVVKEYGEDKVAKLFEQKKMENTQDTLEYMKEQHETKKRILDKLLKGIETKADDIDMFTNIKDLATAYGIIIDKELKSLELKLKSKENEEVEKKNGVIDELIGALNKAKENK